MNLTMGMALADIRNSHNSIKYYKDISKEKNSKYTKALAAYHLQQACEKLIKLQIYNSGCKYNNKDLYTHNLVSLYNLRLKYNINVYVPHYIVSNLSKITTWEVLGRYDCAFSVRIDTLERYIHIIDSWYNYLYNRGIS